MKIYSKRTGIVREVTLDTWDQMLANGMSKHFGIERGQKVERVLTPPTVIKFMEGKPASTDKISPPPQTSSSTQTTLTPKYTKTKRKN